MLKGREGVNGKRCTRISRRAIHSRDIAILFAVLFFSSRFAFLLFSIFQRREKSKHIDT